MRMLHGHFLVAFRLNPFAFVFLPLLGWLIVDLLATTLSGQHLPRPRASSTVIWLLIVVIVAYTVSRNVFPWLTTA